METRHKLMADSKRTLLVPLYEFFSSAKPAHLEYFAFLVMHFSIFESHLNQLVEQFYVMTINKFFWCGILPFFRVASTSWWCSFV